MQIGHERRISVDSVSQISVAVQVITLYTTLPFGLATAPRAFTKVMKLVATAYLREKGQRMVAYLDDLLLVGKSKQEAEWLSIRREYHGKPCTILLQI